MERNNIIKRFNDPSTEKLNIPDLMQKIYREMEVDLRLLNNSKSNKSVEFIKGFEDALHDLSMIIEQETGIIVKKRKK